MRLIDADALMEILDKMPAMGFKNIDNQTYTLVLLAQIFNIIKQQPSAQPEIKPIEYRECSMAMMRMWMDNVVTDGEYNRIMDKLNAHWVKENG